MCLGFPSLILCLCNEHFHAQVWLSAQGRGRPLEEAHKVLAQCVPSQRAARAPAAAAFLKVTGVGDSHEAWSSPSPSRVRLEPGQEGLLKLGAPPPQWGSRGGANLANRRDD